MIIFNFNVLARPGDELGARVPDPDGMKLFRMMHNENMGRVGLVVDRDVDKEIFETWLVREQVKPTFWEIVYQGDLAVEKVHRLSTMWGRADWYIDNDVEVCTKLLSKGVKCLIFGNPAIMRPEWHVAPSPRPWDALKEELDRQAEVVSRNTWGETYRGEDDQ